MEKELHWQLSDNADMSITVDSLNVAMDLIRDDISDIDPNDIEKVFYTLTPVMLTEDEYEKICNETT